MSPRKATPADLKERSAATQWAENHPLRGLARQAMFFTLARLTNKDRIVYAGVRFLAWRMGSNTRTVTKIMIEFRERGLVDFIGRGGLGGQNRYRLNYDKSVTLYPDTMTSEQFKLSNAATHFDGNEVWNGVRQFEQAKCGTDAPEVWNEEDSKCGTDAPEVWNGCGRSVEHDSTKVIEVNKQVKKQDAHCRLASAQPPRGWLAARPENDAPETVKRKATVHRMHHSKNAAAAYPDDHVLNPAEVRERIARMAIPLRSYGIVKGGVVPLALKQWAADPRVTDPLLNEALSRFLKLGDVCQRVREFDKIIQGLLNKREHRTAKRRR